MSKNLSTPNNIKLNAVLERDACVSRNGNSENNSYSSMLGRAARKILSVVTEKLTQGDLTEACWRGE